MADIVIDLSKFPRISKTTLNGALSFIAVTGLALPSLDTAHVLPAKVLAIVSLIAGVCRFIVGKTQTDADRAKVDLPNGKEADVPAHPTPDDPALVDKVVKPQ